MHSVSLSRAGAASSVTSDDVFTRGSDCNSNIYSRWRGPRFTSSRNDGARSHAASDPYVIPRSARLYIYALLFSRASFSFASSSSSLGSLETVVLPARMYIYAYIPTAPDLPLRADTPVMRRSIKP